MKRMPRSLRWALEGLRTDEANKVWAYLDGNPLAVEDMIECLIKSHRSLVRHEEKKARDTALLKCDLPTARAERYKLFNDIARAYKGKRTIIYRDQRQDGTLSVKIDSWLEPKVVKRLKALADGFKEYPARSVSNRMYRIGPSIRFYFEKGVSDEQDNA